MIFVFSVNSALQTGFSEEKAVQSLFVVYNEFKFWNLDLITAPELVTTMIEIKKWNDLKWFERFESDSQIEHEIKSWKFQFEIDSTQSIRLILLDKSFWSESLIEF